MSGIAAQLIATKFCFARGLCVCSARASNSLPVPLSPSNSTVADVGATFSTMRQAFCIVSLIAMTPASGITLWRCGQGAVLLLEVVDLERALHQELEHVGVDRLLVEIVGPKADGLDRVLLVELPGHHDHLGGRGDLQGLEQRRHALGHTLGVRRQSEVLQDDGRLVSPHRSNRRGSVASGDDFVTVKAPLELLLQPRVIFDDQQCRLIRSHGFSWSRKSGGQDTARLQLNQYGTAHKCEFGSPQSAAM